jgi:hypothetical protein
MIATLLAKNPNGFPLGVLTVKYIRTAISKKEPAEEKAKQTSQW